MKMIVGLGNPGARYGGTRHNVGFMAVDAMAKDLGTEMNQKKADAIISQANYRDMKALLVKPQTYMNLSGASVAQLIRYYSDRISDFIVVHDDMDVPFGRIRFKSGGGSSGHKGLRSITEMLASQEYDRLRIGVGRPPEYMKPEAYVLAAFDPEEKGILADVMKVTVEALKYWMDSGCAASMNQYNGNR